MFLKVKLLSHSEAGGNDVLVRTDWSAKFERENSIWQRTNLLTYTYTDALPPSLHFTALHLPITIPFAVPLLLQTGHVLALPLPSPFQTPVSLSNPLHKPFAVTLCMGVYFCH